MIGIDRRRNYGRHRSNYCMPIESYSCQTKNKDEIYRMYRQNNVNHQYQNVDESSKRN